MPTGIEGLNADFQNRLRGLMGVCGVVVGPGGGARTTEEQADLYHRKPNLAAPPGHSNHETGMAADIQGDLNCAHAHAAEFGLRFPMLDPNGQKYEPWHIEPAGVGGDMGGYNAAAAGPPADPASGVIAEFMDAVMGTQPSLPTAGNVEVGADAQAPAATGGTAGTPASADGQQGSFTDAQIAQAAYAAGFRGDALVTAVAVALAESGGNPGINAAGQEDSRGLWQVNVDPSTDWGRARSAKYGDLYNPGTNAQAAFDISGGGTNWQPWTMYRNGTYQGYVGRARAAAGSVG